MLLELPGLTALAALSRPFLAALSGLLALLTWLLLSNSVAWRRVDKKISRSFANRFVLAALHAWGEVISNGGCDVSTPRGAAVCRCRRRAERELKNRPRRHSRRHVSSPARSGGERINACPGLTRAGA